jgi:hypothetical protein
MKAVQGKDSGGLTRDYLIECSDIPEYHKVILGCAICYLSIYLPVIARLEKIQGREALNDHDIHVYTLLTQLADDPLPLLTAGKVRIYPEQRPHHLLPDVLLEAWEQSRGGGAGAARVPAKDLVEVLEVLCGALAANFHHYHKEHMLLPHAHPEDEDWDEKLAAFSASGGGSAHGLTDEQLERIEHAPNTSKMSESTFGRLRYIRERAVSRNVDKTCGLTVMHFNNTGKWLVELLLTCEDEAFVEKVFECIKGLYRARKEIEGNCILQALKRGLDRKLLDDAILEKLNELEEKLAQELEKLKALRVELGEPTWERLKRFSAEKGSEGLLDLCRAMKKIDAAKFSLTEHSSKYLRLKLLAQHYKLTVSDADLRAAAGAQKPRAATAARRRNAQGFWEVDAVVGVDVMEDGGRGYMLRWKGCTEEADEAVRYCGLCGVIDGELSVPHPEIEAQVAELDAVTDEDLRILAGMDSTVRAAQTSALSAGTRVLVSEDYGEEDDGEPPVWRTGVVSVVLDGHRASVLLDGDANPETKPRTDIFVAPPAVVGAFWARAAYDCDLCHIHASGKRWWYGRATPVDGSFGYLCRVEFDNGDVLDAVPTFHLDALSAAVPLAPAPQAAQRAQSRGAKRARAQAE